MMLARIRGAVEYACPQCLRFQHVKQVDWRTPRRKCRNKNCTAVVAFGVLAALDSTFPSAKGARYVPKAYNPTTANWTGYVPDSEEALGQIVSSLEWWCPRCTTKNMGHPLPGLGYMACSACAVGLFFSIILYKTLPGAHATTPSDWIPPLEEKIALYRENFLNSHGGKESGQGSKGLGGTEPDLQGSMERAEPAGA